MRRLTAIAALALLVGCGGEEQRLEDADTRALRARVADARAAAQAGDRAGAERALRSLRTRVARLRRAGDLGDEDARALTRGANRALERLAVELPPPAPPPPPPVAEEPPPADDEEDDDGEGGKKKGKGKKD